MMVMRRRSHRQKDDKTTTIEPPVSESDFSFTLIRISVSQICLSTGLTAARKPALEALADVATRYLQSIAKVAAASANSHGRTQSNLPDIIAALQDLAASSSSVSAVIVDLIDFVKRTAETPFARPLPTVPPTTMTFPGRCDGGAGRWGHVPRWLPDVPVVAVEEIGRTREEGVKWWGCLDDDDEDSGCSDGVARNTVVCSSSNNNNNKEESESLLSRGKRGKIRFKLGVAVDTVGDLRRAGIRKRVWCE